MGRYYRGDIEGKLMFGVQPSHDADYFGVRGKIGTLLYCFEAEHLTALRVGIHACREALGDDKARLDEFFEVHRGYTDELLHAWWKRKFKNDLGGEWGRRCRSKALLRCPRLKEMLQWYARLKLGEQILAHVEARGVCRFEAEA